MPYKCQKTHYPIQKFAEEKNVSLTYLRGLEIPELNEEDMPMI